MTETLTLDSAAVYVDSAPTTHTYQWHTSETFAHSRRRPMTVSHDVESLMSVSRWCAVALNGPGHHGPCRQRHVTESHHRPTHTASSYYQLCQPTQLLIRRILLQLGNNRFCWPKLWNILLDDITSASPLTVFWGKLKTHLFWQSYPTFVTDDV